MYHFYYCVISEFHWIWHHTRNMFWYLAPDINNWTFTFVFCIMIHTERVSCLLVRFRLIALFSLFSTLSNGKRSLKIISWHCRLYIRSLIRSLAHSLGVHVLNVYRSFSRNVVKIVCVKHSCAWQRSMNHRGYKMQSNRFNSIHEHFGGILYLNI